MLYFRNQVCKFVILFEGRTASTYLALLLDRHPKVRCELEIIVSIKGAEAQLEWAKESLTPPLLGYHCARGFKTKLRSVMDREGFAHLLRRKDCQIIHMQRRNRIKVVVSMLNARRLHEATGEWNLQDEAERLPPFRIDVDKFDEFLKFRERLDQELDAYVARLQLPTLAVFYEDLLLDKRAFFDRIFSFIGVGYEEVQAPTLKATSDNLRDIIVNFDVVRSNYIGTPYEEMFDEVLVSGGAI